MPDELTAEQEQARRARVAASNRAFGRVLSIIGIVLVSIAVLCLIVGGIIDSAVSAAEMGGADRDALAGGAAFATLLMTLAPGILSLLAMCALIPGEQMRRGRIGFNPAPPATKLPSATMVSQFRLLSIGTHAVWVLVSLVLSLVLVGIPVLSWFTGAWPSTVESDYDFTGFWVIYGSIVFGITVAVATSLFKKIVWLRGVAAGTATAEGGPGKGFWRWIDFRFRFDLWFAGVGGFLIALSFTFLQNAVGEFGTPELLNDAIPPFVTMLGCGVALIVLGAIAAAQYWRSGQPLGSGESYA